MSSGRLPLDSSYRKLTEQRRLRDEIPRETNIQPSVAWVKLNAKWIRGKEREGGDLAKQTKKITFQAR